MAVFGGKKGGNVVKKLFVGGGRRFFFFLVFKLTPVEVEAPCWGKGKTTEKTYFDVVREFFRRLLKNF
ncbi:hypothetical protein, partial [Escherichia coli]